jgi:hypothetical protein
MQEWSRNDMKWDKKVIEHLKVIFSREGGLFMFVYEYLLDPEKVGREYWLIFSKEEEKMLEDVVCKFFPRSEDVARLFLESLRCQLKKCFSGFSVCAVYVVSDRTASRKKSSSEQLHLALRIRQR